MKLGVVSDLQDPHSTQAVATKVRMARTSAISPLTQDNHIAEGVEGLLDGAAALPP